MLSGFLNVRSAAAKQAVITAINLLGVYFAPQLPDRMQILYL